MEEKKVFFIDFLLLSFSLSIVEISFFSKLLTGCDISIINQNIKFQEIFPKEESLKKEFNSGLNLKFTSKTTNNTNLNNLLNNDGRLREVGKYSVNNSKKD